VTVDGNVAYDTSGHCFMTEDGNEKGNVFSTNLGALTRKVSKLIPDNGTNGKETDDAPATFWMTNPSNSWIGNVAAGSESNGFWMELRDRVRGPNPAALDYLRPKNDPLTLFRNNVAHSNRDKGLRTYPHGYMPSEQGVFYESRLYRNRGDGLFFHNSRNLAVVGGVFADNREQLDFDQAEGIDFRDALVIGVTPEYRSLIQSQSVSSICGMYSSVTGIQLHSFSRNTKDNGAAIKNITISGFMDTGCDNAAAFKFDDKVCIGRRHFVYTEISSHTRMSFACYHTGSSRKLRLLHNTESDQCGGRGNQTRCLRCSKRWCLRPLHHRHRQQSQAVNQHFRWHFNHCRKQCMDECISRQQEVHIISKSVLQVL
jgi:hypothetical protein